MNSKRGLAEVNSTRLHYEIAGTGDAVVFIHGLGSDLRVWGDQFAIFAEHYRALRYDTRGHGKSALPTGSYAHADDLAALLDFLDIAHAHLVGQSLGGEIALDFALIHPDRVQRLILIDSALGGFQWSDEWNASWGPIFSAANTEGKDTLVEVVLAHPLFTSAVKNADVRSRLVQIFTDYSAWHFMNADPVRHPDPPAAQRLHEVTMPTLIVSGEYSPPDFHAIAALLERIPHAQRIEMAGVGHVVPMEAPERLNEIMSTFLA